MKLSGVDKINVALVSAACLALVYMFTQFASAADIADVKQDVADLDLAVDARLDIIELSAAYDSYYNRLDDFDEATDEANTDLAQEYARQMERLKAIICEHDTEWERCDS